MVFDSCPTCCRNDMHRQRCGAPALRALIGHGVWACAVLQPLAGGCGVMLGVLRCRLAERFMAHDVQRQSPVLSQVADLSEAHLASLPLHARRKLSRLVIQVCSL